MKGTIKLNCPITINGQNVDTLTYDTAEITAGLFIEAEANTVKHFTQGKTPAVAEVDYAFHINLGFAAVLAVNPGIDITDLERVKGKDTIGFMRLGRDFICKSEEESEETKSGEQLETTQELSAPQQQTSAELG